VVTVAPEVVPSPTIIAHATPAPATTRGGASVAGITAILFSLVAAVIGITIVCGAAFRWPRATVRPGWPREHYGQLAGEDRRSRPDEAAPGAPNPGDSRVDFSQDSGPPAAVPVSTSVLEARAAPLTVKCFGGPQVVHGDRVLWPSREFAQEQRAWELLFFLAASPAEGVDRDAVGAALWSEVDLADVAGSLRQLRRRLRLMLVRAVPGLSEGPRSRPTPVGSSVSTLTWCPATRISSRTC
jgi:hypothetical protein